jgi:hypothetical protein
VRRRRSFVERDRVSRSEVDISVRERERRYDVDAEADFYNDRALQRARPGEAYNGATKDWTIVDVPPGTERVKMDGIGGASEEITWSRYNGVRRSKFIAPGFEEREEIIERRPSAPKPRVENAMWTEITKDLVSRDALMNLGYEFEETEFFFYVIEYLRYVSLQKYIYSDGQKLT